MTRVAHSVAPPQRAQPIAHARPAWHIWVGSIGVVVVLAAIYMVWVRPWHLRWGATDQEITMPMPGDPWILDNALVSTRGLTIDAPPAAVWPWVAHLGQERGGFYSYAWLENLFLAGMHNADQLPADSPGIQVGDRISYMGNGPAGTYNTVDLVEPEHVLVSGGWTWLLEPMGEGRTRLVVRYPFPLGPDLLGKLFYFAWFEPAHFVMEAGMMMGIKARAEEFAGGTQ